MSVRCSGAPRICIARLSPLTCRGTHHHNHHHKHHHKHHANADPLYAPNKWLTSCIWLVMRVVHPTMCLSVIGLTHCTVFGTIGSLTGYEPSISS